MLKTKFSVLLSGLIFSFALLNGCASTYQKESTGQYIDGSVITAKVKSKLLENKSIRSLPITVKTYKNTVQLSGFVDSQYQKNKAGNIARSVEGVASVQNQLIVKSR